MARKKQDHKGNLWHRYRQDARARIGESIRSHRPWEIWVDVAATTILTLLFTWLAIQSTFTGNLLSAMADTDSPELIDLYISSARRTGVPKRSDIMVLPIDGCSRQEVTTALELLNEMQPKAIGVDVVFPNYADGDDMLVEAIMSNANIVMASCPDPQTYFEPILRDEGMSFGSVVLDAETRHSIVRTFSPVRYSEKDTTWSFEMQLAQMAGADISAFYPYDKPAYIVYANLMMDTLSCKDLLASDADMASISERIKDKIVLIGDMHAVADMYRTPVDADMPGMMIHAYALDTVLRGNTIAVSPQWLNWLVAGLVCITFAFIMLFFKWGFDAAEGLALRITQLALMLLVVVIPGVWFFWQFHWYFDFTPTFFALAIQALVLDIWVGLMAIGIHIAESIQYSKNNTK